MDDGSKLIPDEAPEASPFQQFIMSLSDELNKSLNPSGEKKVGFALFLFGLTPENSNEPATVLSNTIKGTMQAVVKSYVARLRLEEGRKTRRSGGISLIK